MQLWVPFAASAGSLLLVASFFTAGWDAPPVESTQIGYRGSGMYLEKSVERQAALKAANVAPPAPWEADPSGDRAGTIYENLQVLGDLSDDQLNQFMASITEWVAPEQGCEYCHNLENLASDENYRKVVARRMIQMNQAINVDWDAHVGQTGVTCYTCHRGKNIPENHWMMEPPPANLFSQAGMNGVNDAAGKSSLPKAALTDYLLGDEPIRVHSLSALAAGTNSAGVKETERTFSLMVHMSESLGVNCVTCHNSRAFNSWDQSPPQRVTAWHGIRMVRALNNDYLTGLTPIFPENRKGPDGDVFKVNCGTCHNGVQKPLYGISMLQDYLDALDKKGPADAPDYSTYVPGETKVMGAAASEASPPPPAPGPDQAN